MAEQALTIQKQAATARQAIKNHNAPLKCMLLTITGLMFAYHSGISIAAFILRDQFGNDPCLSPLPTGQFSYSSWLLGLGFLHCLSAVETLITTYVMWKFDNANGCLQYVLLALVFIWWVMGIVFFNRMTCSGPLYTFALTYIILQIFGFAVVCQWLCNPSKD